MPTASRTVAAAFVISLHVVLQCAGKLSSVDQRKHQVKIQEKQLNSTNQTAVDTTFLTEDNHNFQDAENLQMALTILTYEPQKIDAKTPKVNATKDNAILVAVTPPSVQTTTETAPEKQYYEVPRRALRSRRAHAKPAEGADTVRLAGEASAPRHAYELTPEAKRRSIARPRSEPDSTPSPSPTPPTAERTTAAQPSSSSETSSPARKKQRKPQRTKDVDQPQVQLQEQASTPLPLDRVPRPFSIPTDASPTASNHHERQQPSPFKSTDLRPSASAEPPGAYSSVPARHNANSGRIKVEQVASATAPVEHPYLPPYATDDYFFAPPQGNAQLNYLHANDQLNKLHATPYTAVAVDHNHLAPYSAASVARQYASQYTPVTVDQQHGPPYSSAPVDPIPPRHYHAQYSTSPVTQRRTTTYPTDAEQKEPIGTHQTYPSRRYAASTSEPWDYNETRPTRPADRAGGGGTPSAHQDDSYATQRTRSRARLDHTTSTTSPEHQILGYGSVPMRVDKQSRRENTQVYITAPTWPKEVQVYPTAKSRREGKPLRREDNPGYSDKPPRGKNDPSYSVQSAKREEERSYPSKPPRREEESFYPLSRQKSHARPTSSSRRKQKSYPSSSTKTEEKQSSPTVSSSQSEEQDYSTVSSESNEEQSYSTPPSRREHSQNYETPSPRLAKPTLIIPVDHTAAPNEEVIEATRPPLRRKPLPVDDEDYDQDVAPPIASVEQSLDNTNDPQPSPALKQQQPRSEYQEYVDTTDYADYIEPRSKDKGEGQDKDQDKDQDKGKEKDEDNKQYNFSYVERVEEPLDESGEASYNVHEVSEEEPEQPQPRPTGANPVLQRGGYKIVQPIVIDLKDQLHQQLPPADYQDQAEGRKADQEVAQETRYQRHKPKGEQAEDLVQSAGHHKKHHKKPHKPKKEHHDEEEGGHAEHHEGEHHEKGHKGHKGYKEHHEHDESKKGHHDKEGHDHHYDEKKGDEKKHHEEQGHHEEHEKGEKGEKKHAFSEKGHHQKGHSTKGKHVVHKKDAYEKKIEFFDDFHDSGDHEKHGGYHHEHHHKKGGHHHKGHHHKGEHEGHHGKKGHHKKGHHHHEKKGHKKDEDDHHHHDHHYKHGKKGGHEDHKHWHHKKG